MRAFIREGLSALRAINQLFVFDALSAGNFRVLCLQGFQGTPRDHDNKGFISCPKDQQLKGVVLGLLSWCDASFDYLRMEVVFGVFFFRAETFASSGHA